MLTQVRFGKEVAVILTAISLYVTVPYIWEHAQIGHRGEGTIVLENVPAESKILLDGYLKGNPIYHVLEGQHEIKILSYPNKFTQSMNLLPYDTVTVQVRF